MECKEKVLCLKATNPTMDQHIGTQKLTASFLTDNKKKIVKFLMLMSIRICPPDTGFSFGF